jgi:hypothetical protein
VLAADRRVRLRCGRGPYPQEPVPPGLSPIAFPARVRQHLYIADRGQGTPADITEVANGLAPH